MIYHHYNLTQQGPAGRHFAGGISAALPALRPFRCLACGNGKDGEPGWSRRPGAAEAATRRGLLIGKHGDGLWLLPGSSRAAVAAWEAGPDDLAAELNPHKTELNPHKAVPGS